MQNAHTDETFKNTIAAFPRNTQLSESEKVDLRSDLDEILNIYEDDDGYFSEAVSNLEKKDREGTKGGRPPDNRATTLILSLLTVYQRYVSAPVEDWEVGAAPRSNFPKFAAAALQPIYPDADGSAVERIAKKWHGIRAVIVPKTP